MQQGNGGTDSKAVTTEIVCDRFSGGGWVRSPVHLPREIGLAIHVNRQELVTILCTPIKLNYLVLGFLHAEGIINGAGDIASMRLCEDDALADVRLINNAYELPAQRTITSGCGGGPIFRTGGTAVKSELVAAPEEVLSLMKQFQEKMDLYRLSGGVHTSALSDTRSLLVVAEDIGRHNTIDKIQGECLAGDIPTGDRLLLTTGRISSEMLNKAARMQVPIVVSRHSPTGSAVSLARDLGITLVGHARGGSLTVYSRPERLGNPGSL